MRTRLCFLAALGSLVFAFSCAEGVALAPDQDGDGFSSDVDCDDADPEVNPTAFELCDKLDNDCDGEVDEEATDMSVFYEDVDGDGHGVNESSVEACWAPDGYVEQKGDCNDEAANIHPGAEEDCEVDVDMNCDGSSSFSDVDGDGYAACEDCDDGDPTFNPGATEICEGIDQNCDGDADTMCECLADPLPLTEGADCASAIDLGSLSDVNQDITNATGNGVPGTRETWYHFEATDDLDTAGDEFHVDVRFTENPLGAYQMDVFRSACPEEAGEQVASAEIDVFDWYTDQPFTTSGCTVGSPCGEGDCVTTQGVIDKNTCNDNTATFYVKVSRLDGLDSCDSYTLELSNGVY